MRNRNECHILMTNLAYRYERMAVGALVIRNMVRSAERRLKEPATSVKPRRGLNSSRTDQTWGLMGQPFSYKAQWAGRVYVEVDPRNTSRTGSRCGVQEPEQQGYRVLLCPE